MSPQRVSIAGIGAWAAGLDGWPAWRAALRDPDFVAGDPLAARRPAPLLLPPAERRRVPDGIAVALEVAREALHGSGVDGAALASVFASAHGELAIVDYLCATLAGDPALLSPTRFHHSVHNAAAGYWSIATPSVGPATALAAGEDSFALGLLEATTQVIAEGRPVLLVAFDTPAVGLLAAAVANASLFGAALVLVPHDAGRDVHLAPTIDARASPMPMPRHAAFRALAASSPSARAIALLEALAIGRAATVDYPMNANATISVSVLRGQPRDAPGARPTIE